MPNNRNPLFREKPNKICKNMVYQERYGLQARSHRKGGLSKEPPNQRRIRSDIVYDIRALVISLYEYHRILSKKSFKLKLKIYLSFTKVSPGLRVEDKKSLQKQVPNCWRENKLYQSVCSFVKMILIKR